MIKTILLLILLLFFGYMIYHIKIKSRKNNQKNLKTCGKITTSTEVKTYDAFYKNFKMHPSEFLNEFSLKERLIDSDAEDVVYSVLKTFINEQYMIFPHVSFRDVFKWRYDRYWRLTNKVALMHFDFGVYDKDYHPVLFVEVNGGKHEKKNRAENDLFKKELMNANNIKLVTIDLSNYKSNEEIREILIREIKSEVPNRKNYSVYCPECDAVMHIRPNKMGVLFYGCSRFPKHGCHGSRGINEVPPLYDGIPTE